MKNKKNSLKIDQEKLTETVKYQTIENIKNLLLYLGEVSIPDTYGPMRPCVVLDEVYYHFPNDKATDMKLFLLTDLENKLQDLFLEQSFIRLIKQIAMENNIKVNNFEKIHKMFNLDELKVGFL